MFHDATHSDAYYFQCPICGDGIATYDHEAPPVCCLPCIRVLTERHPATDGQLKPILSPYDIDLLPPSHCGPMPLSQEEEEATRAPKPGDIQIIPSSTKFTPRHWHQSRTK